jgi:hypothetical protein
MFGLEAGMKVAMLVEAVAIFISQNIKMSFKPQRAKRKIR